MANLSLLYSELLSLAHERECPFHSWYSYQLSNDQKQTKQVCVYAYSTGLICRNEQVNTFTVLVSWATMENFEGEVEQRGAGVIYVVTSLLGKLEVMSCHSTNCKKPTRYIRTVIYGNFINNFIDYLNQSYCFRGRNNQLNVLSQFSRNIQRPALSI